VGPVPRADWGRDLQSHLVGFGAAEASVVTGACSEAIILIQVGDATIQAGGDASFGGSEAVILLRVAVTIQAGSVSQERRCAAVAAGVVSSAWVGVAV